MTIKKMIGSYLATIGPSIYISRTGKVDIRISEAGSWGCREQDRKLYSTSLLLAAEDITVLRSYKPVPDDVVSSAVDFARSFNPKPALFS